MEMLFTRQVGFKPSCKDFEEMQRLTREKGKNSRNIVGDGNELNNELKPELALR